MYLPGGGEVLGCNGKTLELKCTDVSADVEYTCTVVELIMLLVLETRTVGTSVDLVIIPEELWPGNSSKENRVNDLANSHECD